MMMMMIALTHKKILELSRLRGVPASVLSGEVEALREEARGAADGERWGMARVLRDSRLRLPLLLVCSMQAGQQTSGINAVSIPIIITDTLRSTLQLDNKLIQLILPIAPIVE
jgi:hypothetical protein